MLYSKTAGLTDVGQKREGNEDAFLIDDASELYVVADGMGGHLAGEVASKMVVDSFRDFKADQSSDETTEIDETVSPAANRLLGVIQSANRAVHAKSRDDEACRGMGSTVSAVLFIDTTLIVANVGDSPIYLVRDGNVEQLSVSHTVAAEQAAIDPDRLNLIAEKVKHMLTRAIGVADQVVPDLCELQGFEGDRLILCSDGLSNMVSPEEMAGIAMQHTPAEACRRLVDMANERGGDDNITVIVLCLEKKPKTTDLLLLFFLKLFGFGK